MLNVMWIMNRLRFSAWTILFLIAGSHALAIERNVMLLGDDYDYLNTNNARQCERECQATKQCIAWTFIKRQGQCRLKSSVYRRIENGCCVSGDAKRSNVNTSYSVPGRFTTCSFTFEDNYIGWRQHKWKRRDCTNGLPPANSEYIGQASNGNGSGGQVVCSPYQGRHFNHPLFGATSGTVKCMFFGN